MTLKGLYCNLPNIKIRWEDVAFELISIELS